MIVQTRVRKAPVDRARLCVKFWDDGGGLAARPRGPGAPGRPAPVGAAGGIAATFNTPIGGMVFAVELMLPAANSRTLMPLGIASVVATYVGRAALGLHPAFNIPTLQDSLTSVRYHA